MTTHAMNGNRRPDSQRERLARLLLVGRHALGEGHTRVRSEWLASVLGDESGQVRRDLGSVPGSGGRRGYGYQPAKMVAAIENALGLRDGRPSCVIYGVVSESMFDTLQEYTDLLEDGGDAEVVVLGQSIVPALIDPIVRQRGCRLILNLTGQPIPELHRGIRVVTVYPEAELLAALAR